MSREDGTAVLRAKALLEPTGHASGAKRVLPTGARFPQPTRSAVEGLIMRDHPQWLVWKCTAYDCSLPVLV